MMNGQTTRGTELVTLEEQVPDFAATAVAQRAVFLPTNFREAMEMAALMARGLGVRPWMRGKPEGCFMVLQQAIRWGMDPYAVANKAYETNGTVAYESQLVNAVINTSRELIGRLKIEFSGDASGKVGEETLNCRVSGRIKADPDQIFTIDQPLQTITVRNSPLWKVNPKQQLIYYTTRVWARLYMPEVLLGVYTPDELVDGETALLASQTAPATATAPDRRDFVAPADADGLIIDAEHSEVETGADSQVDAGSGEEIAENEQSVDDRSKSEQSAPDKAETATIPVETATNVADSGQSEPETAPNEPVAEAVEEELPLEPLEWAAWETELSAAVKACVDMAAVTVLRKDNAKAIDAAEPALAERIQDIFADRIVDLSGN